MVSTTASSQHIAHDARSGAARPTVGVFCKHYLPTSQTFVRDHLRSLRTYRPVAIAGSLVDGGLKVDDVPVVVREPTPMWTGRSVQWLARHGRHPAMSAAVRRSGADLVHAHFGTGAVMVRRACRHLNIPLVVTFHGYDVTVDAEGDTSARRLGTGYANQRRAVLHDAAAVITVSQYLAGRLAQLGAAPSKVHVIPCGVDTTRFAATPVPASRRIVFVGRLVDKKGCADLLHAVAAQARATSVTVIGDGPLREPLTRLADDLHVSAQFLGAQPHGVVRDEIRGAQLVALPSRTAADGDQEGLPVVALEAAASGRPVVGYRHSGIPEAVVDGQTGLLAVEGDVDGLAASLQILLDDLDWCREMGSRARDRAVHLFDLQHTTTRIEQVYDRVRNRTRAPLLAGFR